MSLEDVALAVGLPGKIGGRGSEIEAMVRRGEIDKVRACCQGDCLNVFVLYVWWALLSGRIDPAGCNASLQSLIDFLESERDVRLATRRVPGPLARDVSTHAEFCAA